LWMWAPSLSHVAAWAAAGVLLVGGVISTSSSADRLAQPYRVSTAGADVDPPGVAVAPLGARGARAGTTHGRL